MTIKIRAVSLGNGLGTRDPASDLEETTSKRFFNADLSFSGSTLSILKHPLDHSFVKFLKVGVDLPILQTLLKKRIEYYCMRALRLGERGAEESVDDVASGERSSSNSSAAEMAEPKSPLDPLSSADLKISSHVRS
jgi:hypothetical protein